MNRNKEPLRACSLSARGRRMRNDGYMTDVFAFIGPGPKPFISKPPPSFRVFVFSHRAQGCKTQAEAIAGYSARKRIERAR